MMSVDVLGNASEESRVTIRQDALEPRVSQTYLLKQVTIHHNYRIATRWWRRCCRRSIDEDTRLHDDWRLDALTKRSANCYYDIQTTTRNCWLSTTDSKTKLARLTDCRCWRRRTILRTALLARSSQRALH